MPVLGVDLGFQTTEYAVVDEAGSFLRKGSFATPDKMSDFFTKLCEVRDECNLMYELIGAGFSLPGAVDNRKGTIGGGTAFNYGAKSDFNIHTCNFKQLLQENLNMEVVIANDANCAALGEAWAGAGEPYQDIAYMALGSGVGGALVHNKEVLTGRHCFGGEFGYMIMDKEGHTMSERCTMAHIIRKLSDHQGNMPKEVMDIKRIVDLEHEGAPEVVEMIKDLFYYLARTVFNIQYSFDPDAFIFAGQVSYFPGFMERLNEELERLVKGHHIDVEMPKVLLGALGDDANLLGAASVFLSKSY